jgi:hypothetical protein
LAGHGYIVAEVLLGELKKINATIDITIREKSKEEKGGGILFSDNRGKIYYQEKVSEGVIFLIVPLTSIQ